LLEREGKLAKHYGLCPTYVVSGYKAARRPDIGKSKPLYTYRLVATPVTEFPEREPYEPQYHHAPEWNEEAAAPDDYDPEIDVAEESADMQEEAVAACFDSEGYETE
jgi:hypothetical protein